MSRFYRDLAISVYADSKTRGCAVHTPLIVLGFSSESVVFCETGVADAADLVLGIAIVWIPGVVGVLHVEYDGVGRRTVILPSSTFQNFTFNGNWHSLLLMEYITVLILPFVARTKVRCINRPEC